MAERTVFGDISPRTAAYAAKRLLTRGQHQMLTERFGQSKPIPKKSSSTVKFRRYESMSRATAPLAEGITPGGQKLTKTDVTATLQQYGDLVEITDVIQDTHEDPVLMEAIDICGEQAAETLEVIRVAILRAGSNVFYANGVASRATVNSVVSAGDLRRVVRYFNRRKAKPISQIVKASAKISTEPVAQSYFAMCHTDMKSDIREIAGFTPVEQYSNSDRSLPGEIGKVEEIRFVCSALVEPFLAAGVAGTTYLSSGEIVAAATACDVYPILIVAQDAYGIVPLQGKNSVTPTVLNPDKPSKSDPLAQRGMVSWKTYHTACILNQNWLARVETACTAKP